VRPVEVAPDSGTEPVASGGDAGAVPPEAPAPVSTGAAGPTVDAKINRADAAGSQVVVECTGLARYFGGVRALDGLDLQIREGELVGLVGPNGSGKTTLVNLLSGAIRPSRGSIRIAGRDTSRLA